MSRPTNDLGGFLKGIRPSAFLDCYQEWHALVEGFCEVLCPWPARHQLTGELLADLKKDHHYYMFGRAAGILAWLTIFCVMKAILF
ncbi:MAG: hypothetical protein WBH01_04425 [Dehalococcoidia bacterium]